MKNVQKGFAAVEMLLMLPLLGGAQLTGHTLGVLMIGLSMLAWIVDHQYRTRAAEVKSSVRRPIE